MIDRRVLETIETSARAGRMIAPAAALKLVDEVRRQQAMIDRILDLRLSIATDRMAQPKQEG